jgi:hypothetical protein
MRRGDEGEGGRGASASHTGYTPYGFQLLLSARTQIQAPLDRQVTAGSRRQLPDSWRVGLGLGQLEGCTSRQALGTTV